ncbi:MAG: cytochrome P450 [Pikeienuella sp.]
MIEPPFLDFSDPAFSTRSAEIAEARAAHWCARTPYGLAVLRWREVGHLLRDRRLRQGSHAWPDKHNLIGPFAEFWRRCVIGQEGEAHQRLRALAVPVLTDDYINSMIPEFERAAADLTSAMRETDRCEFQSAFAMPFAGRAVTTLFGMPDEEWDWVSHDATELGLAMGVEAKRHEDRFNAAYMRLEALAERLIARVRVGEDDSSYVARMVARFDLDPEVDMRALLDMIVISIFGGVDTTRAQLGLGLSQFIENPTQWQALRDDAGLIPQAVDEIIQARPTTTWASREAVEAFEFGGVHIRAGETLHMLVHASARDPLVASGPVFDITTKRKRHFGFGGGAHHCIGHMVARTDIAAALRALRDLFVTVDYDGPADWLPDSGNTGPVSLPIKYQTS